jgi:glycosyltransferase involved in cell wall biosynthesis
MSKNLAYVVFNESIFDNLIKTQVIELLSEVRKKEKKILNKIYLINFLPITKIFKIKEYKKKSKELEKDGIKYIFLPLTLHSRIYFFNILFPFFGFIYGKFLKVILFFLKVDIIHCRSYFATLLGLQAKRNEKLIFDTRSLFIEENISINKIKENSLTHTLWKKKEIKLLEKSSNIIVIDEIFKEKYLEKVNINQDKIKIIPIYVNDNLIFFDQQERDKFRKELNIEDKQVYIYTGSFYGWNDINVYFDYFKKVIKERKDVFFIILTKQVDLVKRKIKEFDFDESLFFYKLVENSEIRKYLSAADYGVILMRKNKDSETRLGVKFLEYMACNLKIITNNNVGLACKIVEENNIGINIENEKIMDIDLEKKINSSKNIFNEKFSAKKVIKKYLQIYEGV